MPHPFGRFYDRAAETRSHVLTASGRTEAGERVVGSVANCLKYLGLRWLEIVVLTKVDTIQLFSFFVIIAICLNAQSNVDIA